jgi:hypothetical protein
MKRRFRLKWRSKNSRQPRPESATEEISKFFVNNTLTNVNIAAGGIWQEARSRKVFYMLC